MKGLKEGLNFAKKLRKKSNLCKKEETSALSHCFLHHTLFQCICTMMTLIRDVSKEHVIQYVLVMLDDLLLVDKDRVKIIHQTAAKHNFNVWPPLKNLLNRDDQIIMHVASRLLAKLSTFSKTKMPDSDLVIYLTWLKGQFSVPVSIFHLSLYL